LTDYFKYAHIYDVIVDEKYRGHGFGRKLIETVLNYPSLATIEVIQFTCRKKLIPFYEKFGFSIDYGESASMNLRRKK
jgi:GNAT superfamily N-acetyltransferase